MNCISCNQPLESGKKGFIVCPRCGTVNAPPSSAPWSEPHITELPNHNTVVVHPAPQTNKLNKRLTIVGSFALILILSGAGWAMRHKQQKVLTPNTPSPVAQRSIKSSVPTPTPPSAKAKTKAQASSPSPSSQPAASTAEYTMNVLVLKYFPLTADGRNINIHVTGDVGDPYSTIRQRTVDVTNNLKSAIEKGTKYLGYKNTNAQSAISPNIVATKEYTQAVPIKASHGIPTYPNYAQVLTSNNICNYVNNHGVQEVWIWAYQGPDKSNGYPSLAISESKMSSVYGDVSNSWRFNDMPKCAHTYVVYTFNYGRGTAEAFHSWGHQIEAELTAVDNNLFRNLFQGDAHPQIDKVNGRCGSVHNPPNSRFEYDYDNTKPQNSDCLDWQPDGGGKLTGISCKTWGCGYVSDNNNSQLNWLVWMWQNLPGIDNTKAYHGKHLRNWWDVHAKFDSVMGGSNRTLFK